MMEFDRRMHQVRRATVARSALDVIALIFLACSFVFWSVAFYQLLAPPQLLHLLTLQAGVLALVYALAAPLLLSALVPTTPAGQLLQKTQWRTFGFAAVVASAVFLFYQGEWMIESWLISQPAIAAAGMQRSLAISLSIAFVLIPALAWTQLTPERWLAQIQQAHAVKKLEMQQSGEIAIIKARLLWAEQKAALSYANLLPAEQAEIRDTLQGLLMGIADTQRGIARTLGISAEIERAYPTLDDSTIADTMEHIAAKLEVPAHELQRSMMEAKQETIEQAEPAPAQPALMPERLGRALAQVQRKYSGGIWGVGDVMAACAVTEEGARDLIADWLTHGHARVVGENMWAIGQPGAHEDTRLQSSIPREEPEKARRQVTPYGVEYARAAWDKFGRQPWTVKGLATALSIGETKARELRDRWGESGVIAEANLGRWYFTESEVQR